MTAPRSVSGESLCLFIEVPICAFRPYESREYQDTYPVPPPSAVYGMLLSLVGVPREEKARHRGVAMTIALESLPGRSRVFRKLRRDSQFKPGGQRLGKDLRPDYQDLLIDVALWAWIADGEDRASPTLAVRARQALAAPSSVQRFGGLSLGESSYLVNSIRVAGTPTRELIFLRPEISGFEHLPTWVDHDDATRSVRRRFDLAPLVPADGVTSCRVIMGEPESRVMDTH